MNWNKFMLFLNDTEHLCTWRIWLIYVSWFTDLYDAASLNLYYEVLKSLIFVKLVKK